VAAGSKARLQNEAERFMLQGKIPQAIDAYLKIVQDAPEDVMTLNTVGDLYLTIGYTEKANDCFIKVAEKYVSNNFFLKAIAVYKKILSADPFNLEVNAAIASLYAKQGLNIDACNQYLKLVQLFEESNNTEEIAQTYEKIVELDPKNAAIQQKLANIFLADGNDEKGREHLLSAAQVLVKTGDHNRAKDCYEKAVQIDPLDITGLKGFMVCCLQTGNLPIILNQLKETLESDPDNLDVKEMLGQVHLVGNDPEAAAGIFQTIVTTDESRYQCFFHVAQAFINQEKYDQASECLDPIIPTLITRRRTDIAEKHYKQILEHRPDHLQTMEKLASIYSAAGDTPNYLEVSDKIVDLYVDQQDPITALEYLEKIIQADPDSKKHLDLHKVVYIDAHPDTPYVAPIVPTEAKINTGSVNESLEEPDGIIGSPENVVEADLLVNYGMKEKALGLLQNLEARDPYDKKVRTRLLTLFKEEKKNTEAAQQCLLLAVLYGKSKDEDSAGKYMAEAKQLDPDLVDREQDLDTFARKHGVVTETISGGNRMKSDPEVDLSGDLMDIFFTGEQGDIPEVNSEIPTIPDEIPQEIPSPPPTQTIEEKLQEVDFYIRLGFSDEALNKMNEIAKISPDNPELPSRFEKLKEMEASGEQEPTDTPVNEDQSSTESPEDAFAGNVEDTNIFQDVDIDKALDNFSDSPEPQDDSMAIEIPEDFGISTEVISDTVDFSPSLEENTPTSDSLDFSTLEQQDDSSEIQGTEDASTCDTTIQQEQALQQDATVSDSSEFVVNDMFSDLLEEVSTLSEQEITKESFEDHFSLGTAYRDMDLIEEAIKEFQTALRISESTKDSRKLIQCCGMLSTCFLKKSMPRSALRWCQTGLGVENITSQEAMALRYDMGVSHSMEGNQELALQCFDQIFNTDPGYRDIAQKIDEIKSSQN